MKKLGIVAVLLAAGAFAASGLFAQGLVLDGYINSGLGVVISTEEDAPDPFLAAAGTDSWENAYRIWLNARYTSEAGNVGAHIRLQASGGYNFLSVPIAYGWFSAFDKILTVNGGIVDNGTWNTGGAYFAPDQGEGLGTLIKVSPISGLDLGVGAYLIEVPGAGADNATISDPYGMEGISFGTGRFYANELDDVKYTFNASYTLPDLLKFIVTYRPKAYLASALASQARVAVSVLAVPNLTAILELDLGNLQDFKALKTGDRDAWDRLVDPADDDRDEILDEDGYSLDPPQYKPTVKALDASGKINIGETFQYNMGSLSVGLWGVQWISQAEDTDFSFYLNPWVSYAIGSIVPRLDLGYGNGVRANFYNNGLNWRRGNVGAMYDSDYSVISIRPSVKINLDSTTFVEIGDLIDIDGGPDNTWGTDNSKISNVFYVDFKWSF
jgi:hypothetical protein